MPTITWICWNLRPIPWSIQAEGEKPDNHVFRGAYTGKKRGRLSWRAVKGRASNTALPVFHPLSASGLCGYRKICGAEALARWHCPKYGDVSPAEFIPILEQNGLIIPLGSWVLYHAVEQCRKWRRKKPDFHISVNLSYRQLLEGDIVEGIRETLDILQMPPEGVILELTETYLVKETAGYQGISWIKMKQAGIMLAMDDFGIGYSSLFSLKSTPVDMVKIDRGFVKGNHLLIYLMPLL